MKISLLSDIHAEYYRSTLNWLPPLPDNPDVLVLAGDIHVGKGMIDLVTRISEKLPETHIVIVAGNHEFYRQYRVLTINTYKEAFANHDRIHFLENDYVDIGGIRFIGATLWTGFPLFDTGQSVDAIMAYVKEDISDFSLIADDSGTTVKAFTPEAARELFIESKAYIGSILKQSNPDQTVVITHFPPAMELRHPKFEIDMITSYFTADCLDLIQNYQPVYWFYGHNHWSLAKQIGKTMLVSNQFGYPGERERGGGGFAPNLIYEL